MVLLEVVESSGVVRALLGEDGVDGHCSLDVRIDKGIASREASELSEVTSIIVALSAVDGLHNYGDAAWAELYVVLVHEVRP